ncbi:DNA ligase (ATP) [Natronococcus amylolyticus DSM 10524]|uniref:DNA ligase n=1 Tax=Natronococcus amylolyticus DSM 10524 TaxID=1227497 RepID=L9WXK5_9EURY|nr:ATP-dependent DNA ligase [Natronococcus amylolyticus]ELY53921.1 DNA ligase (ATP) [Natronococcus amylolyticus DSM 10524]
MQYADLVESYRRIDATASTDEKTAIVASVLEAATTDELERLLPLFRGKVTPAYEGADLGISSSLTLEAIRKATGVAESEIRTTWHETGDLGTAAAEAVANQTQQTLFSTDLTVESVFETLRDLLEYEGEGSQQRRIDAVAKLLSNAEPEEARYVVRTVLGHLRIGIGEGTIRDAIAQAALDGSDEATDAVEYAYQLTNDYPLVARTARESGVNGLRDLEIELFRPLQVMLADSADSVEDGIDAVATSDGPLLAEYKYDGVRVQIHKDGDEVRAFTRRLEEITEQFPDVVESVRTRVAADSCVLEGEIVGYDPDTGALTPFQELSTRITREHDIEAAAEETPVVVYLFDLLSLEGESLLEESLDERLARLDSVLEPEEWAIEPTQHVRFDPADPELARELYADALAAGHEGLMCKNLEVPYQPGRRVGYMLKVKPTMEPLDVVVTRGKYSEGRRKGKLGRLYLACRDTEHDELNEVGRLATGYTDEQLAALTDALEPLITETDGRDVNVRPEVVLEVEYEEIQSSPTYDSGYALRFPRFVRRREELSVSDVDTLERVEALFEAQ